jgi:hypothetical protein
MRTFHYRRPARAEALVARAVPELDRQLHAQTLVPALIHHHLLLCAAPPLRQPRTALRQKHPARPQPLTQIQDAHANCRVVLAARRPHLVAESVGDSRLSSLDRPNQRDLRGQNSQ